MRARQNGLDGCEPPSPNPLSVSTYRARGCQGDALRAHGIQHRATVVCRWGRSRPRPKRHGTAHGTTLELSIELPMARKALERPRPDVVARYTMRGLASASERSRPLRTSRGRDARGSIPFEALSKPDAGRDRSRKMGFVAYVAYGALLGAWSRRSTRFAVRSAQ